LKFLAVAGFLRAGGQRGIIFYMDSSAILNFIVSGEILRVIAQWIWRGFAATWWFVVSLALFYIFAEYWKEYITLEFKKKIQWIYLEVKVPRDIETTPKAMEQVFSGFYGIMSTPLPYERFFKGKVPLCVSFEIVGAKDGIHFYVATPKEFRRLVETQFYSQYSQIEIKEVENYTKRFTSLPNHFYSSWGAQMQFTKESVYPIKTYPFYEEIKEEKRLDSLAPLLETLSHLKDGEEIWIQIVFRPLTLDQLKAWEDQSKVKVQELMGKKVEPLAAAPNPINTVIDYSHQVSGSVRDAMRDIVSSVAGGVFVSPKADEAKKEEKKDERADLSPGQRRMIEDVEKKMAKPVFEAVIRTMYVAPQGIFDRSSQSAAIRAHFQSFNIAGLNGFMEKVKLYTNWRRPWKANFQLHDLKMLFVFYNFRVCPDPDTKDMLKKMILSAEELATLYHFPISTVSAPGLYRAGVRKSEPPPNLPVL
jgi:hypothetical protein